MMFVANTSGIFTYLHLLVVFVVVCQQEIEIVEYHPLKTASALTLASSECTLYLKANATGLSATKATVLWRSKCYPFSTFLLGTWGKSRGGALRKRVDPFCLTLAIKTKNEHCHIKNTRRALLLLKRLKIHNKDER